MALGDKLAGNASASAVKAGEAFFEVNADDSNVMSSLKRLGNRINSLGGFLKSTGLGIAGVGSAVLAPIVGLFAAAVKDADDLNDVVDRLDSTAESVTRLGYAAKLSGATLDDIVASTKALNGAMIQATEGNKEALKLFDSLGVSAEEFAEVQLEDKFRLIADAAEQIDDPIERANFTMGLLGKQAITLAPLLKNGADGLDELYAEAEKLGAVKTGAQIKEAGELMDTWDKSLIAVKSTLLEVGYAVFGMTGNVKENSNSLFKVLATVREWIKANRQTVMTIASVAASVVGIGGTLAVFGVALSSIVGGLVAVKSAVLAVITVAFSPFILKLAVVSALVYGVIYALTEFTESGKTVKTVFLDSINSIGQTFSVTFKGMIDSLKSGNLAQAGEIASLGLQLAWEQGNLAILKSQKDTGLSISSTWADVTDGLATMWNDLTTYIAKAWTGLTGIISYGMASITDELGITTGRAMEIANRVAAQGRALQAEQEEANAKILAENVKKNQEIGLKRMEDIKKAEAKVNELQNKLNALALKAAMDNMDFGGGGDFDNGRGRPDADAIARLGDAVKGTFGSADYRGTLGIGPASDAAKEQTKELKEIRQELIKLNRKPGLAFG